MSAAVGLPDLAGRIRAEIEAAERDWRSALGHALQAGELLIEAKAQCGHGSWLQWLKASEIGERNARNYMRVAANRQSPAVLESSSIDGALKLLARPSKREAEQRPPWSLPGSMPDVLPAADPQQEAALRQRVREKKAALECAVTEFEDAQGAYAEYARSHKPGPPLVSVAVEVGWAREGHEMLYRRRVA